MLAFCKIEYFYQICTGRRAGKSIWFACDKPLMLQGNCLDDNTIDEMLSSALDSHIPVKIKGRKELVRRVETLKDVVGQKGKFNTMKCN